MQAELPVRRALLSWIAAICVAVLLVATAAEAAHACELPNPGAVQTGFRGYQHVLRGPCLICAAAHSPSLATAQMALAPELSRAPAVSPPRTAHPPTLGGFALHVRPPPIF